MSRRVSLIINTAALDPHARQNMYRASAPSKRADILSATLHEVKLDVWDEIFVSGVWTPGEGYIYISVPPRLRDRSDALLQREKGARHATGDILVFCHDDHMPAPGFAAWLKDHGMPGDIVVPKRIHEKTGATLTNGSEEDYMGGHCLAMTREVWAEVPWTSTMLIYWDLVMTQMWRDAGFTIAFTDELVHYDREAMEDEE